MTRIDLPLSGAAYRVAQQAYADYGRGDYEAAAAQAREAIRQRPDVVSLRLLLANSLAAERRLGPASQALSEAIAQLGPEPSLVTRRRQIDTLRAALRKVQAERARPADPDTLTGDALTLGKEAYAAYASKDFKASADYARQTIALRPDLLRLRLLYIDAASAAGLDEDAWQADLDAVKRFGDNDDLRLRRTFIGNRLAPKSSAASFAAFRRGDLDTAVALAQQTVQYAPDQVDYRIQLISTLFATGDLGAVEAAAGAAIANDDTEIMPLVLRGYVLAAQGKRDAADADFARALKAKDATERNQRVARVIIADVWIADGEAQRALDMLAPLRMRGDDTDPPIAQRRYTAHQQLAQAAQGKRAAAPTALDPANRPIFDCTSDQFGATCYVYAADAGFAAAREYASAAEKSDDDDKTVKALAAEKTGKGSKTVAAANNQNAQNAAKADEAKKAAKADNAAAVAAARKAVEAAPQMAQHRVELIDALTNAGDERGATREARKAIDDGLLPAMPPLTAAYVAQHAGESRLASDYFKAADQSRKLSPNATADAAFAAEQAHRNAEAAAYFERAIDAATGPAGDDPVPTAQQVYDMRNAHADVTRNWGFDASLNYRGAGLQPGFATVPTPGISNNWQAGVEAYWRPFGSLGDRMFEVYARGYENFGVQGGGPTGASTLQLSLGARVKPFSQIDAIFAFERIIPIGASANPDWLARLAYSGGFGTGRRIDVPSWWTTQIYAETGRYLNSGETYGTTWIEAGRTYRMDRISPRWTVFPYLVAGADYDSSIDHSIPTGAGVGISTRYWFRDSKYDAPRSYVDVSVQYRWRLAGDSRARGVFFGTVFSY
ncbi:bacteriophage N4 adsorption protein A [Paraburkholderia ferrariae]|uniref:bacteriophage N4 adsorption protein A n=1 Tax=Paraburkholderia ferrariae TaxID=386056 RepID=UPI00069335E5|nr:bacteriophage N4 adsorption protein A [Paraburkholderia ferrariae]